MVSGGRDIYSHGKEYYMTDADFYICVYEGKVYYMNSGYLCSSDTDGSGIRIITCEKRYKDAYIQVNPTGIYLYKQDSSKTKLDVKRIGFDGKAVLEVKEKGRVSCIYIYGDNIYYVKHVPGSAEIRCMDMNSGSIACVYSKASEAARLCVSKNHIVFEATYKKSSCNSKGWMIMDRSGGEVSCLSSDHCNPERILDNPKLYARGSAVYVGNYPQREIVYCDLNRGILWTERTVLTGRKGEYGNEEREIFWEPKPMWGDRNATMSNVPAWRVSGKRWIDSTKKRSREYFDGEHFYQAECYHLFDSADERGNRVKWNESGHGACDEFTVSGGYLFLDLEALGEEQYQLTNRKSAPLRRTWFKDELSEEVISNYKKGGKNAEKTAGTERAALTQARRGRGPEPEREEENKRSMGNAGRGLAEGMVRSNRVVPLQLMNETTIVSRGNEFWTFNTGGKTVENRFKIDCIYEEGGAWHVIEKKEGLVRGTEYVATSPLMTADGNVCFFAECRKGGKCAELFVTCRREGEKIVFETDEVEGAKGLANDFIHTAVVQGNWIYGMGRHGQWFSFDMDAGIMSKAQIPLPPMHAEFDPWKDGFKNMYAVDAYYYDNYIYTAYFGMQNCMFRFPLGNVWGIEHVSLIDASTNAPGMRFVATESSFVYKNILYNFTGSGFYMLNLDNMVYSLARNGYFKVIGKMSDNRLLIQTDYSEIYRIYDLDEQRWYKLNDYFFNIKRNGDDVRMLSATYSGSQVVFSYKKTSDRISYSAMSWSQIADQNARLVDFAVK